VLEGYLGTTLASLLGFTLVVLLLGLGAPTRVSQLLRALESRRFAVSASIAVLTAFTAALVLNAAYAGYLDHAEPTIASVSWLLSKGIPIYHPIDSADRYSILYGPTTYLPYAGAMWLGGGRISTLKIVILAANVGTLAFLWRAYRTIWGRDGALLTTSLVLVFLFVPRPNTYLFQVRGDVLIVTSVAAGLYAASCRSRWGGVVLSLAAAVAIDAKVSGFLYFVPVFLRFAERRGWRATLTTALGALGIAALPFLLPNVSLPRYWAWFQESTRHPRSLGDLMSSVRSLAALALPLLLIAGSRPWRSPSIVAYWRAGRPRLLALAVCVAIVVVLSSKLGAGPHHLLPFIPVLGYEYALLYRASRARWSEQRPRLFRFGGGALAVFVVVRVSGVLGETCSLVRGEWARAPAVLADVEAVASRYAPRRVEMGYGEREEGVTLSRLPLVVANNHVTVDDVAVDDMQLAGLEVPPATVDELGTCSTAVWLIPKGEAPFRLENFYRHLAPGVVPDRPLFSGAFRDAFLRTYRKDASTEFFDLWVCGEPSTMAPAP
jgi:hypothetical protein